jgi:hypothetical protein
MRYALIFAAVLASAGAAAAAPTSPPSAATRQLMARLGDGSVPVVGLIDPAKGIWLVGEGRARQICAANALLDIAVEAQIHARTWGAGAACVNREHDATCTLRGADPAWPSFELRFDRGAGGLVLRALVREPSKGLDKIKLGATCATPAVLATPPPPIVATARRDAPSEHKTPTVATVAMLDHLAERRWAIDDFADRERGLVIVYYPPGALAEGPSEAREARVCGAAIAGELAQIRSRIARNLEYAEKADAELSCRNQPTTSECVLSVVGEWGPVTRLHFRQTDHGLVLDAYSVFDEHQVSLPSLEQHDILVAQRLAHAAAEPCPP